MSVVKSEHRCVIKFLTKEGTSPKTIHARMIAVYGDEAPSYFTVKYWSKQFRWGRESTEDDPRSGRPSDATNPEVSRKVETMVLGDRRLKVSTIAKALNISEPSVLTILHDKLGLSKVSARWVPRLLTPEQKLRRQEISQNHLASLEADPDFFSKIVTGDETWVHHWDPETKLESMQWVHKGSPPPKKARTQSSAGKLMATVFWDQAGIILIEYMPKGTTITAATYCNTLKSLRKAIDQKRPGLRHENVLILHDNARVHKAIKVQPVLGECNFSELDHPPYSPDLAPSDFFLFRNLKKHLRGRHFLDDNELKEAVDAYFEDQEKSFFSTGIKSLQDRWRKCIEVSGDYVEK